MSKFSIHKLNKTLNQTGYDKLYTQAYTVPQSRRVARAAKNRLKLINGGYNGSTKEYKDVVLRYWSKYGIRPKKFWYDLYCNGKEAYDPRYISDAMWYRDILPYFNYYIMISAYKDKGMYSRLFPDVKKPETIVKNIAGHFYNGDGDALITREEAEFLCSPEEHLILKPSVHSGSGRRVLFYDRDQETTKSIQSLFDEFGSNFVVQRLVKQHPDLARINKDSLNTVRVVSFHYKGEVHILSTILRMGGVGARVDNISAGGISCVIKPDGWLAERAVTRKSVWTDEHASGIKFKDIRVPSYEKILETARRLHKQLPYFNIVGWDFAVDEEGNPVFIEFNAQPEQNQISCGPTFGDLSDEVFDDVFLTKSLKSVFNEFNK